MKFRLKMSWMLLGVVATLVGSQALAQQGWNNDRSPNWQWSGDDRSTDRSADRRDDDRWTDDDCDRRHVSDPNVEAACRGARAFDAREDRERRDVRDSRERDRDVYVSANTDRGSGDRSDFAESDAGGNDARGRAGGRDGIAQIDVETGVFFLRYRADVSVETDGRNSLASVDITGGIPGIPSQGIHESIDDFRRAGGFTVNGPQGKALYIRPNGIFSNDKGGSFTIGAKICGRGFATQSVDLRQSGGDWGLARGGEVVSEIRLDAQVQNGQWTGCFTNMEIH